MKKVLTIVAIIASLALNGWLGYIYLKKLNENQSLKSKISSLEARGQASEGGQTPTVNFIPSASVKPIYDFAQENQGLLKKLNCYCGCQNPMHQPYHKSLANCFVKEITAEGQIIYDAHGQNCKTCIDEALDVKKWLEKQENYIGIKELIDNKYKPANYPH